MDYPRSGMASLVVLFAAVVLNVVAFSLPLWTTSATVNESLQNTLESSDFTAGVWGFCTDVKFFSNSSDTNAGASFDHCFLFHTATQYDLTDVDAELLSNFSDYSVCDGYSRAGDESDAVQLAYATALATTAGMDATQFDKFLSKSCGALGKSALAFGGISMGAGALSFVSLALGITCCKKRSAFVKVGDELLSLAVNATIILFALWIAQAHPLGKADDVAFNASFILAVISAALYVVAIGLLAHYTYKLERAATPPESERGLISVQ